MPVMIWTFTFEKKNIYFLYILKQLSCFFFLLLKVKPGNETGGEFKTDVFSIKYL